MDIMVTMMGIISALFTLSNTYFAFRLNRTKLQMEQAEINRKKEAEEVEKKRSEELDVKLDTRNTIVLKELDTVKTFLNKINDKVDATNSRLDKDERKFEEHETESGRTYRFLKKFNLAYDHSLEFFSIPDERFKLILTHWGERIRDFGIRCIDDKYDKDENALIEFDPETHMESMVSAFYELSKNIIPERCDRVAFNEWLEGKKIHNKSMALALNIKKLNLSNGELNKAISTYFVEFSKAYGHAVGKWIEVLTKKAA